MHTYIRQKKCNVLQKTTAGTESVRLRIGLTDNDSESLRWAETMPKKAMFANKQWKPIKGI